MSLLDKTNLLITPNAVKAGKLYSVIPASGTGDCTVVRNTTATRVISSGLIESIAVNVPRLNYDSVGGNPSVLVEPQITNLINYSQDFAQSYWNKGACSIISNSTTSPSGIVNADKLVENTASARHILNKDGNFFQNNLNYSFSVFVKPNGRDIVRFQNKLNNGTFINTYFNLSTGVISSNAATSKIENIGGYFRISHLFNSDTGTSGNNAIISPAITSGVEIYTGNGVSGIFVWGAQLAIGDVSSYIPTTNAAVTRNADVITVAPPTGTVKITTTFSDNTTQIITSIPALFTVPEGLIKQVLMQSSL